MPDPIYLDRAWHMSPYTNRTSIQQHGLDWSLSNPDYLLQNDDSYDEEGNTQEWPRGQYFWVDQDVAYDEAEHGEAETDLWEVDTRGIPLYYDPYLGGTHGQDVVYTTESIGPERLKLVLQGDGPMDQWVPKTSSEDDVWNITNGDEVLQGKPLDPDDENPHLFQWVPPTYTNDLDEALTDLRDGGYRWNIVPGDQPQMWRIQHKREPIAHDISSRDLQLRGYQVYYNDDYLPRAQNQSNSAHYHLYDTTDPTKSPGRIWATQRVDDLEDWQEPEPGTLNEPHIRERYPDLWQKHWGAANPADWKEKYNYRERESVKRSCATCSAWRAGANGEGNGQGKCLMFDAAAKADMTCDEWSDTWEPKTATIQLFEPPDHELGFETYAKFILQADWNDVMAKAKRLIQEGKVTILHNTPSHVMAQVIGDGSDNDGEPDMHEVEFSREDPNSNVITQSVCDCEYNQYRWDRTRPWKKFEGRPCSHILAAYWKSKATPQDIEDAAPGYQVPVGQRGPAAPQGQMKIPGAEPGVTKKDLGFGEGAFGPEGQEGAQVPPVPSTKQIGIPNAPQNPFNAPKATPPAPGKNPTPQREQMQLFNLSPEPSTQPINPAVSVPGAVPPTPENPVQLPGTFSKVAGDISRMGDELVGNLSFLVTKDGILMGEPGYHHPDVWQEYSGEQIFNPEEGEWSYMPSDHPYFKAGQGNVGFSIKDGQITDLQVGYDYLDPALSPEIEQKAADIIYAWMAKTGIEDARQVPEDWTTQFDLPGEMPTTSRVAGVDDEMMQHFIQQQANGDPIYVATTKPQTLEFRGGKQPMPGAQPYDVSTEGVPLYKVLELGYNPDTGNRENADVNELSGAPEWRGQYGEVPTNRRGEVRDFDPHLGWALVHVPLHYPGGEDARLHPHSLSGWVPMSELRVVHPPRTPFRRK